MLWPPLFRLRQIAREILFHLYNAFMRLGRGYKKRGVRIWTRDTASYKKRGYVYPLSKYTYDQKGKKHMLLISRAYWPDKLQLFWRSGQERSWYSSGGSVFSGTCEWVDRVTTYSTVWINELTLLAGWVQRAIRVGQLANNVLTRQVGYNRTVASLAQHCGASIVYKGKNLVRIYVINLTTWLFTFYSETPL